MAREFSDQEMLFYIFHYCPLLNRKYHAVIEQEQNISGARQYFLEITG